MQQQPPFRKKSFDELKDEARGQWTYIFEDLAPALAEAISAAPYHVACPVHGGSDGFRLFPHYAESGQGICNTCGAKGDGFSMLAWVKGYSYKDAVFEVAQWLRNETVTPTVSTRPKPPPPKPMLDYDTARAKFDKVWKDSTSLRGTPVERYLLRRGIPPDSMPPSLKAHPSLTYFDGKTKINYGRHPCLVAQIKNSKGTPVSVHRIYLTPDGNKANVPDPKRMMAMGGDIKGAAIRLVQAEGDTLSVTEGIETALGAYAGTRIPVWACVTAPLMELVEIPSSVAKVIIWADKDKSGRGEEAANKLAKRLREQGLIVEIFYPPLPIPEGEKGIDWLDIWNALGPEGFPEQYRVTAKKAAHL